jgi:class 3 adenylate cyclase
MGDVERPKGSLIHELRTPLTQVIGFAELLAEEAEAGPPRDLMPSLRRIAQAGRRLTRLLDEHFGRCGETGDLEELPPLSPTEDTRLRAGFERRSRRLREVLGRLVGEEVMAWLLEGNGAVRLLEATLLWAEWWHHDPPGEPGRALEGLNHLGDPMLRAIADTRGEVVALGPEGLKAIFGFPEARPDDAERAVRAALRVQLLALEMGVPLRVGLASGRVAAGLLGNPQRASFGVVGAPVEAARCLCAAAAAGRVLATKAAVDAAGPKLVTGEAAGEGLSVIGLAGVEGLRLP